MTETLPLSVAGPQAWIDASPFDAGMGITVTHADAETEEITVRPEMRPEFERARGTGQYHGSVISAFIDTVGDYVLVMSWGGGGPSINYRTDFLRPAPGIEHRADRQGEAPPGGANGRRRGHRRFRRTGQVGRSQTRHLRHPGRMRKPSMLKPVLNPFSLSSEHSP